MYSYRCSYLPLTASLFRLSQADRDGDGELGPDDFYRIMKHKGSKPLDISSSDED